MKVGDKVEVIGHTKGGGQQFDIGEIVEVIRIGSEKNIKCSNGGNEQWWLDPSEYRPCELPNIHSLHGSYFTAEICFTDVVGRISHDKGSMVMYLCHDNSAISLKPQGCSDMLGYEYAWPAWAFGEELQDSIQNLKILPSPLEYHKLLTEILPTLYSFDPTAIMIKNFISEIKVFDPKNLGK